MRALQVSEFGSPEVLTVNQVEKPQISDGQLHIGWPHDSNTRSNQKNQRALLFVTRNCPCDLKSYEALFTTKE